LAQPWEKVGTGTVVRIYLTGRIAIEADGRVVGEQAFPGRQARLAFAYLGLAGQRPVARDALADAIWGDELPTAWDAALTSLVSKLRSLLRHAGLVGAGPFSQSGCYQLRLSADCWVDVEACARAVDSGEAAWRRGDVGRAWSEATVATAIARRPFLAGDDLPWVDEARRRLRSWHVRALDCLAEVMLASGEGGFAVALAAESIGLEPYRESGYQRLMRAHALAGDHPEALRAYDGLADLLRRELGATPHPSTTALRNEIRRGRPGAAGPP